MPGIRNMSKPLVQFEYLSDRPDAVPIVAGWYSEEWGHLAEGRTYGYFVEHLREYLVPNQLPLMILAVAADEIVGAAQLKHHELENAYPNLKNWMGGIYVAKPHRGNGIGKMLVKEVLRIAPAFGIRQLYLQTEALDGGLYARLGWKPRERYQGPRVQTLIMEKSIDAGHHAES